MHGKSIENESKKNSIIIIVIVRVKCKTNTLSIISAL